MRCLIERIKGVKRILAKANKISTNKFFDMTDKFRSHERRMAGSKTLTEHNHKPIKFNIMETKMTFKQTCQALKNLCLSPKLLYSRRNPSYVGEDCPEAYYDEDRIAFYLEFYFVVLEFDQFDFAQAEKLAMKFNGSVELIRWRRDWPDTAETYRELNASNLHEVESLIGASRNDYRYELAVVLNPAIFNN